MPTYSYLCDACGKSFEKEQRIIEDAIKKCVFCGKDQAHRQIVSGNFILKGGGWYSDGYGSSKSKASAKGESSASSESKPVKSDTSASPKAEPSKPESSSSPSPDAAKGGSSKASAAS